MDVYFTDYHPHHWNWCAKGFDHQRMELYMDYRSDFGKDPTEKPSVNVGSARSRQVPKEEEWPKLDGSGFWLQLHGTNLAMALMMIAANCGMRSEKEDGEGRKHTGLAKEGQEVMGSHRGIYTSKYLQKAWQFAYPLWSDCLSNQENQACTKICLLVTTAGVCRSSGGSGGSRSYWRWWRR